MRSWEVVQGDSREVLAALPDNSVDAVVTDPPYELTTGSGKGGFMGKEWDATGIAHDPTFWREVLRVLKPGGHLFAFGGTRTYHRLAVAIEDAGFDLRDCIAFWQYLCLSEDTEILTDRGWVQYDKIVVGDLALCYDAASDTLSWGPIEALHVFPDHNTVAFRIHGAGTDQVVTGDHRCPHERGGTIEFSTARDLASQREARVPILESVQAVFDALRLPNEGTGREIENMLSCVQRQGDLRAKEGSSLPSIEQRKGTKNKESSVGMCFLRDFLPSLSRVSEQGEGKSVFCKMQGGMAQPDDGCRTGREDEASAPQGFHAGGHSEKGAEDEGVEQSCVEGWSNDLQEKGELSGHKVRSLSRGVSSDGEERRVCDGASVDRSEGDRQVLTAKRVRSSYGSQPAEQHDREFGSLSHERRTQTVRASRYTSTDLVRVDPVWYAGTVWCVTVPTGAFVARRKGKAFLTGNSGFPKSLNVSIAIDKAAGVMGHRGVKMSMAGNRTVGGEDVPHAHAVPDHAPITPEAQRARGLGTALKPSQEPIVVARKPLEGTVAANVLKWGTGALNIDGCRVKMSAEDQETIRNMGGFGKEGWKNTTSPAFNTNNPKNPMIRTQAEPHTLGRWPPNTVFQHTLFCRKTGTRTVKATSGIRPDDIGKDYGMHKSRSMAGAKRLIITVAHASPDGTETVEAWECMEGCPVAELDRQSGESKGGSTRIGGKPRTATAHLGQVSGQSRADSVVNYGDAGGASRMFPCFDWQAEQEEDPLPPFAFHYFPKPPASEREAGCEGLPSRQMDESREEDAPGANNPRNRGGRERKNHHPTVKSIALMRWLTRLGCPAGGLVLDPFLGSGTTGCAAMMEGFDFIGIEREAEYAAIAEARIRHWQAVAEREDTKTRETP